MCLWGVSHATLGGLWGLSVVRWHGSLPPYQACWSGVECAGEKKKKRNAMEMDLWRSRGRCLHAGSVLKLRMGVLFESAGSMGLPLFHKVPCQ